MNSLILSALFFSGSYALSSIDMGLDSVQICEPVPKRQGEPVKALPTIQDDSIVKHMRRAEQEVAKLSHYNRNACRMCYQFLVQLHEKYRNGEGFIDKDMHRILEAISFSAEKHQFQTRKDLSATPYIVHPIDVAYRLLNIGNVRDPDILIAALLHDTVEDTDTSFEEIRELFGPRVEGFVREVTDDKSLPKMERKKLQIINAPHKSAGAAQIKLADKLSNLSDMLKCAPDGWSKERLDNYFSWATMVVSALPWVNAPLKAAVDEIIQLYWEDNLQIGPPISEEIIS